MIPESKIPDLWAAARRVPTSDRIPYAFEKRVMSALPATGLRAPAGAAVAGLWRAALLSVAVAVMASGLDFAVQDLPGEPNVEETLELAVLPADDVESDL